MKELFIRLGRVKSSLLIIFISVVSSFVLTLLISYLLIYFEHEINIKASIALSIIIPLLISVPISWYSVGFMLEINDLKEELEKLANYDVLTNLLTRRAFFLQANACVEISKRKDEYLTLFLIDLDFFKKINDQFGHPIGDKVLEDFSKILKENFRKADILGRFGGEEFICLLPNTNKDEAQVLAKRLLEKIRENHFLFEEVSLKYTISLGVTTQKANESFSFEKFVQVTDKALYRAKESGRDRFEFS